ncbi:MAG: hypothetical protein QXR19_16925 [Candidatus Jordarchaeaceae archaeon]
MRETVDLDGILKRYEKYVYEIEEIVGIWEFHIHDCPIKLKIKVVRLEPQGRFMGVANYGIKNPKQRDYYWSFGQFNTVQEALEDALRGFLMFWNPKEADKTSFKLLEDW